MIAYVSGELVSKDPSEVVVAAGGLGYRVFVPVSTLSALPGIGSAVKLFTYHYVREDAVLLYGFATPAERRLFTQLLGVSGIGPKVGLALLALATPNEIRTAIATGDTALLGSVPGIGKKTAERVVVDLRDKMEASATTGGAGGPVSGTQEVVEALVGLGYSQPEARRAVGEVGSEASDPDELLRASLKRLAR